MLEETNESFGDDSGRFGLYRFGDRNQSVLRKQKKACKTIMKHVDYCRATPTENRGEV